MKKIKKLLSILGPGFITGASDDDPSGIATYSQAGAQFGYNQLWTAPFSFPFMAAIQEMCGRVGIVTGKGLSGVIRKHYSLSILYFCVLIFLGITGAYIFLPNKEVPASITRVTLGTSTKNSAPTPALPSKESVQSIVNSAQDALSKITSENITSSQAAIQKVITDLQQLQEKKDAVGVFCEVVCKK